MRIFTKLRRPTRSSFVFDFFFHEKILVQNLAFLHMIAASAEAQLDENKHVRTKYQQKNSFRLLSIFGLSNFLTINAL